MRSVRIALASALSASALLAFGVPATAAMFVRLGLDPPAPQMGETTHVSVLTFSLTRGGLCWDDPVASPIPNARWYGIGFEPDTMQLHLLAAGPDLQTMTVPLARRSTDPTYWDGSIVFPSPGEWTVLVSTEAQGQIRELAGNRCAGFLRTVKVSPAGPSTVVATGAPQSAGPTAAPASAPGRAGMGAILVLTGLAALAVLVRLARHPS
jgi:hypothetical protein